MVGNNSPHDPFLKLSETSKRGLVRYSTLKRRWDERRVKSERSRERCRCRAYARAYPRVDRANRSQDLRAGQITVTDSGRESLKQKILFTRRRIQLRVRRLIRNHQQRID